MWYMVLASVKPESWLAPRCPACVAPVVQVVMKRIPGALVKKRSAGQVARERGARPGVLLLASIRAWVRASGSVQVVRCGRHPFP